MSDINRSKSNLFDELALGFDQVFHESDLGILFFLFAFFFEVGLIVDWEEHVEGPHEDDDGSNENKLGDHAQQETLEVEGLKALVHFGIQIEVVEQDWFEEVSTLLNDIFQYISQMY